MVMNYRRIQRIVDKQIKRFGGTQIGYLRRDGTDRAVSLVTLDYTETDRRGGLIQSGDIRVLISAVNLTTPPDDEQDTLVMNDPATGVQREYRIPLPAKPLAPNTTIVLYWEVVARTL